MGKLFDEFNKIIGSRMGEGIIKTPQKKIIYIITVLVSIGILLMFINNLFGTKTVPKTSNVPPVKTTTGENDITYRLDELEREMGNNLETVLSKIEGVGKVTAQISLASSSESEYAVNASTSDKTTEEKDTKGASRTITEVTKNDQLVMLKEVQGGKETPVVVKEIKPEIQGILVIAEGAGDATIKTEIAEAVETLYHLPAHKVTVMAMEAGDK